MEVEDLSLDHMGFPKSLGNKVLGLKLRHAISTMTHEIASLPV